MNIFFTSLDPAECARDLDDLRVVNQLRETCQLLSGAVRHMVGANPSGPVRVAGWPELDWLYSATHLQSPCARWVRSNLQNFQWTVDHAVALANEYLLRYPSGSHKSVLIAHRFMGAREWIASNLSLALGPVEWSPGADPVEPVLPVRPYDGAANQSLGLDFRVSSHYGDPGFAPYAELVTGSYRRYLSERYRLAELAGRTPRWSAPSARPEWSL